jgi:hypothetical protein
MNFKLAIKAFFKALNDPSSTQKFLEGQDRTEEPQKASEASHLRLLAYLQKSGRFIDFIKEDLSSYNDAQIGAAVRKIHSECGKSLEELVTIRPLFDEKEGATITVPKGFNAAEIKITGKVKGEPPFTGILRHKGWKSHKISLPLSLLKQSGEKREILYPAEIEVNQ